MKRFLTAALLLPVFAFALTPEEYGSKKAQIAATLDSTSTCTATYLVYMEYLYEARLGQQEQKDRMAYASDQIEALERYQKAVIEYEVALENQQQGGDKAVTFQELEQRTLKNMYDAEEALRKEVGKGLDINDRLKTCDGIAGESAARMAEHQRMDMNVTPEQKKRLTGAESRFSAITRCGVVMEKNYKENNGEYNHIRVRTWSAAKAMGRILADMILEYDPSIERKDAEMYVYGKMNGQANLSAADWAAADQNGQRRKVQLCLQLDKNIRGNSG